MNKGRCRRRRRRRRLRRRRARMRRAKPPERVLDCCWSLCIQHPGHFDKKLGTSQARQYHPSEQVYPLAWVGLPLMLARARAGCRLLMPCHAMPCMTDWAGGKRHKWSPHPVPRALPFVAPFYPVQLPWGGRRQAYEHCQSVMQQTPSLVPALPAGSSWVRVHRVGRMQTCLLDPPYRSCASSPFIMP